MSAKINIQGRALQLRSNTLFEKPYKYFMCDKVSLFQIVLKNYLYFITTGFDPNVANLSQKSLKCTEYCHFCYTIEYKHQSKYEHCMGTFSGGS